MDLASLEKQIQNRNLEKQFFVFAGREDYLKEQMIDRLIKAFVATEDQAENVGRVDFDLIGPEEFLGNLATFSFNSSKRIFLINKFESLIAQKRKGFLEKLSSEALLENVLVIFLSQNSQIAGEIISSLKEICEKIDFWAPFENQLPAWVKKNAQELGVQITPESSQLLIDLIGSDLRLLRQELSKLSLLLGKGETISPSLIKSNVSYQREHNIFDLIDSIGIRNLNSTLKILENLLKRGEPVQKIWFMICNSLREYKFLHDLSFDRPDLLNGVLESLRELLKLHGKSDFQANQEKKKLVTSIQKDVANWPPILSASLRIENPMQVKNLSLALRYNRLELARIWPVLVEIDKALKTSAPNPATLLQGFLVALLKGKNFLNGFEK